jgi:signal transduction histidine kinase
LRVAGKKLSYRFCCWIVVVAVFMVSFTVLFFSAGGYKSGMPSFFIFAILYTAMMLDNRDKKIALGALFALYISICVIAYLYPETVTYFETEISYLSDIITGIVVAGIMLLLVITLHIRMYHVRGMQIKELNRELEARNDTLIKYDKMKNDFLAAVAHEISSPLTVIVGSSADTISLLKENPSGTPEKFDEILANHERIDKRVMLLDRIVTDLLDAVAIESGRLPLSRQYIKMAELIKSVGDNGFARTEANRNRVTYDFEEKLPPLWADPGKIEQVMINLLTNADRHTKDGVITVKLTRADGKQIVSVTDNGEGMDSEMAEDVMKMYATSNLNKNWRHGYGLYVCRQIIVSHGGKITIKSEKGRGTTVTFSLMEEKDD